MTGTMRRVAAGNRQQWHVRHLEKREMCTQHKQGVAHLACLKRCHAADGLQHRHQQGAVLLCHLHQRNFWPPDASITKASDVIATCQDDRRCCLRYFLVPLQAEVMSGALTAQRNLGMRQLGMFGRRSQAATRMHQNYVRRVQTADCTYFATSKKLNGKCQTACLHA